MSLKNFFFKITMIFKARTLLRVNVKCINLKTTQNWKALVLKSISVASNTKLPLARSVLIELPCE